MELKIGSKKFSLSRTVVVLMLVLSLSLGINVLIANYVIQGYGVQGAVSRISELIGFSVAESRSEFTPVYISDIYTENKEILRLSLDKHVKTADELEPWRHELLNSIQERIQIPDMETVPISELSVLERDDLGFAIQTKYSMKAFDGDRIIFFEVMPKDDRRAEISTEGKRIFPAVMFIPGSGNQGARDILNIPSDLQQYYYQSGIGLEVAKEGYAVYVIENRGYGLRAIEINDSCESMSQRDEEIKCSAAILSNYLSGLGTSLFNLQIVDSLQLLKYIHSLESIDQERIGLAGLSLGGSLVSIVSIYDDDIAATAIASGIGSYAEAFSIEVGVPNLKDYDGSDLVAAYASRDVYLSFGKQEVGTFRFEADTGYTYKYAKRAYELLDAEEHLVYISHDGGHQYDIPSVVSFLETTIG